MRRITFTAPGRAELLETPDSTGPLQPREVRGRTLLSLVSPGTELHLLSAANFPFVPGYACVFQVDETGREVTDLPVGSVVFGTGPHQEFQQTDRHSVCPLPNGLNPKTAVFARLAGVSMSTLNTASARPPARVLVTGLGPVGNLAAQVFSRCGYEVTAIDPVEERRALALQFGFVDVRASVNDGPPLEDEIALHLECSGHEQAVLDGCHCVRKRGEIVLIGTPWKRQTGIFAHELLNRVFKRYVVLRSGWEWEVPLTRTDFLANSRMNNFEAAMRWLANGDLRIDGFAETFHPADAGKIYRAMSERSLPSFCALFDWRLLKANS